MLHKPALIFMGAIAAAASAAWTAPALPHDRLMRRVPVSGPAVDSLRIGLRQPVYRSTIYPSERLENLRFAVTLPSPSSNVTRLAFELLDAGRKVVRSGVARGPAIADEQSLEVGSLPAGTFLLVVSAFDRHGVLVAEASRPIRKLGQAPGSEVRIDERHNIVVNGRPTTLVGWYGEVPVEDGRSDVVALQNVQTPVTLAGTMTSDLAPPRDAFQRHGIYSVISLEPLRLATTFHLPPLEARAIAMEWTTSDAPSAATAEYMRRVVATVRSEPWLLAYYVADEPESHGVRAKWLEAAYRLLRELDPYHPVIITNDTRSGIDTHGVRACDILNPDVYSRDAGYVAASLAHAEAAATAGKAIMLTPWASAGQAHFTTEWGSDPAYSFETMRQQYLLSIAYGVRGWTAYTSAFFLAEPSLRYGLPPVWRELRFLAPAVAAPAEAPAVDDSSIVSWLGRANGHLYMVAVNRTTAGHEVRISHRLLKDASELVVVGEARTVRVRGGEITDVFGPGDARLYTTDPLGRTLPLLSAVQREIKDAAEVAAKPGNLLYVGGGARAEASPGYFAPWFTQYFYYAINGITDDTGWYFPKAGVPAWLELTLPKEAPVARVVVYTPNLEDFDLQFRSADGTWRVAEVRGNMDSVAALTFSPLVPTLKLRITALKVRGSSGPAGTVVREIEAYSNAGTGTPLRVRTLSRAAPMPGPRILRPTVAGGPNTLWKDSFNLVAPSWAGAPRSWTFDPTALRADPAAGGGLRLASTSARGYSSMTRRVPYDPAFRYLQVMIGAVESRGYDWADVGISAPGSPATPRSVVKTRLAGIYTVDMFAAGDAFRTGAARTANVSITAAGAVPAADGIVTPGPEFTFDWLQLARNPSNSLTVTMADGSPLRQQLHAGDSVTFRTRLDQPAADVAVESRAGSSYDPVYIDGQPYIQLERAGNRDGREWEATVILGPTAGPSDGTGAYPLLFRAVVTGGAIRFTFFNARTRIE